MDSAAPCPAALLSDRRARRRGRRAARSRGRRDASTLDGVAIELLDCHPARPQVRPAVARRGRAGPQIRPGRSAARRRRSRAARTFTRTTWRRCSPASTNIDSRRSAPGAPRDAARSRCTFMGYRRADGRVGTRNEIWILCTVGCVGRTAERIARLGRGALQGPRRRRVRVPASVRLLAARRRSRTHAQAASRRSPRHPNAGGVLILGLGCESNQLEPLLQEIPAVAARAHPHVRGAGDVGRSRRRLRARRGARRHRRSATEREPCPIASLAVGLKCGGSDGLSGITANPLRRPHRRSRHRRRRHARSSPRFPEIFGAERLLMERAADEQVFAGIAQLVNDFKRYFLENDQPVHENPSPGNIAGGITTLEEKSLGAVQKGGHATVTQVLRYGERDRAARASRCSKRRATTASRPPRWSRPARPSCCSRPAAARRSASRRRR